MTRHRPRVARWQEETSQGLAWCYQMQCECGIEADEHYTKRFAAADRAAHRDEVAPPRSQRCRQPTTHRMQWWDRCPLCADQLALPGLEVV